MVIMTFSVMSTIFIKTIIILLLAILASFATNALLEGIDLISAVKSLFCVTAGLLVF